MPLTEDGAAPQTDAGDWVVFEACIEPIVWGKSTYTILPLPADVADTLIARGAKRVEGEINDFPVNLAITRAPVVPGPFLWAGKALLDSIAITPGERLDIRLRPASPDEVEVPGDVSAALRAADLWSDWSARTPGKRRGMLHQITSAKRADTRARRIAALIDTLKAGA